MTTDNLLSIRNLKIGYDQQAPLVGPINLDLAKGEVVCLVGENGVGKTTLLRTLGGLLPPLAGEVLIEGESLQQMRPVERARRLSLVLTEREFPWGLSVQEVLELARVPYTGFFGRLSGDDRRVIQSMIDAFELNEFVDLPLRQLSDGQRQRVLIARSLAQETDVLLLDEPTTFLDLNHQIEILLLLKRVASDFNKTILMTTHHWELILELSTKLWVLEKDSTQIYETMAEELVIRDELKALFKLKTAFFDQNQGRFRLESCEVVPIDLVCSSEVERYWTLHALGKWGYFHSPGAAIKVESHNGRFVITQQNQTGSAIRAEDLKRLISSLRSLSV